ncbi:hypothetical protein MVEN_00600200 [Mycena venus]|uniref:Uncharacterized protein n=1 Tax=Mycena venus TaxID=2733690 RepID=A0A8H6YJT6_9AGAR|nr:hypothetical protein MVEN_00600200 [Mycena venus]
MSEPPGLDPIPSLNLPAELLAQLHFVRLAFAGTTAVFLWDIIHNLIDDYYLFFRHKFRLSTAAYLGSRIASLTYVIGFTVFATHSLGDCQAAMFVLNSFYPLAIGSTSLLFFFRVRAVYGGQRLVSWVFVVLWICVVGSAVVVPIGSFATSIGFACLVTKLPSYTGAAATVLTAYDTAVFLAISCKLLSNSYVEYTTRQKFRALFHGPDLHEFSKALFWDGQKYYMITILSNITTISLVFGAVSPIYHGVMSIPNVALSSIMACRVYRDAKLHYAHIPHLSVPVITASTNEDPGVIVPLSAPRLSYAAQA